MKHEENMTVVYACDDNYAALTAISATSLLKHNPAANIVLLGCNIKKENLTAIEERIKPKAKSFTFVDVAEKIASLKELGVSKYVSHAVYSRIFIADLLPDLEGKILYLDSDTLITDKIDGIFKTDMTSSVMALAPDVIHNAYKKIISLDADKTYYNTGVALIDLGKWRKLDCTSRLLAELKSPTGKNPLGDQDIIVRVLNDQIAILDKCWNFLSQYILLGAKDKPKIYHFSGNTLGRPWQNSSRHPMRQAYINAAAEAGYKDAAFQTKPMPIEYKIQYILWKILPEKLYKPVFYLMLRVHIFITYSV